MRVILVPMVLTGCVAYFLNCTAESIGRTIDPDYDTYLNNRTPEQQKKDEEDREKVRANHNSNVRNSETENELDAKFDSMAREQKQ
jgi:hypothetical protein